MKNNWARTTIGIPAIVEVEKPRSPSHTIIDAIHFSSISHVAMKKPPPTREKAQKAQTNKSDNRRRESLQETKIKGDDREVNKPPSKGTTTAHYFIKFMNKMLATMYVLVIFVDFVATLSVISVIVEIN
ncbi:uncharacterized protein B0P05DRAFT_501339 [Gilbertella persicaria]|uniref:uncharacterized protein n=1 Tax=Gilbertella persicaria TaxID=101096 RepID=UPI00221E8570|nr:uncharacterized protein B0P05DRAFT_501339 [Gilbertella persicaria]KAI8047101.1 hypothetical protein B0P05DRAFT_501339 [Gilbertella persicaria]